MSLHPVIAVDGTAASGKSTFSRELARRLGFAYVNTGAMYRGVTWWLQEKGVALEDFAAVARGIQEAPMETRLDDQGEFIFLIAGVDPLPHLREGRVNSGVSLVAQVPLVRSLLVAEQQQLGQKSPLVMEGRDIGSVVFPETPYKFYIDASPEIRAQRRQQQGETDVIQQRDKLDSQRTTSPLLRPAHSLFLDSGAHSVEELVTMALASLAQKGLVAAQNFSRPL